MTERPPAPAPSPHVPRVSVLLPFWNAERYVAAAVESLLAQSFADFEVLAVDDGSTDGSGALVRGYGDARIRVFENEKNLGYTRSLNAALTRARGGYVARMDADDLCAPERFARQVAFLDANPGVALVATRTRYIDDRGAEIGVCATPTDEQVLRRQLRRSNRLTHGSVMMRAEAMRAIGGYDESMEPAEDYDLWLRFCDRHRIAVLPDVLYAWRQHGAGVGARRREEQDRAAQRARLAARRRFASARIDDVLAGRISAARAARDVLELIREEETAFPAVGRRAALTVGWAHRAPRLHAHAYALWHRGTRARFARILGDCAARRLDPDAACAALVAAIRAIDPASRAT